MTSISVALCTFNGQRHVNAQLRSLIDQTRPPDEVVICDDGSTDGTVECVHRFAATAPFEVRVMTNDRRLGTTANFEKAIRLCRGEQIMLADQDDRWLPHKCEELARALEETPDALMAFSDAYLIDDQGARMGLQASDLRRWRAPHADRHTGLYEVLGGGGVAGCMMSFRSAMVPVLLPFPAEDSVTGYRILHDQWITLLLATLGPLASVELPLMEYRLHDAQQIGMTLRKQGALYARYRRVRAHSGSPDERLIGFARLLRLARDRILSGYSEQKALDVLETCIAHLEIRSGLPGARTHRLVPILRELASGRYGSFGTGVLSALADLAR